jgi:hypothetical protein
MKSPLLASTLPGASGGFRRGLLALALLGPMPATFAQSGFGPATTYFTGGSQPLGVAVGDVNGDGRPDLVVANQSTNNVSVLLALAGPNTAYAPAVTYSTGTGTRPTGVALGDVDGDGRLDIVTGHQTTGAVGVFRNLATAPGTFANVATYPTGGAGTNLVALTDFNGDGRLDIAAANTDGGTVSVFLNTTGTFAPAAVYASGVAAPVGIAIGDVNADGRPDIVTGNNLSNNVGVLLASAATPGTFATVPPYLSGGNGVVGVSLGDVNGDGRTDLVATNSGSATVSVLLGTAGTSLFGPPATYPTGGAGPNFGLLSDVNGDGRLDIVTASNATGFIGVLTGVAAAPGTFAAVSLYSSGGAGPIGLAVADLNNDHRRDIVAVNYNSGTVGVLLNTYIPLATTPAQTAPDISVYPNPAHESFAVLMPAVAGASAVQAELLNGLGQVVRRQTVALPASGTRLAVEAAGLTPGVYTLRLQAGARLLTRRVVLQ